jgi:hypothetical protein
MSSGNQSALTDVHPLAGFFFGKLAFFPFYVENKTKKNTTQKEN